MFGAGDISIQGKTSTTGAEGGGGKAQTHNFAKFSFKGIKSGKSGPRGRGWGLEGSTLERQLHPTMGVDRN